MGARHHLAGKIDISVGSTFFRVQRVRPVYSRPATGRLLPRAAGLGRASAQSSEPVNGVLVPPVLRLPFDRRHTLRRMVTLRQGLNLVRQGRIP